MLFDLDAVVLRSLGLEVGSGAEAAPVATDHDGACAAVGRGVERIHEEITELGVDRVVVVGPVQGQREHVVVECGVETHAVEDSFGSPRMLSPRMLRCTCDVPV